MVLVEPRPAIPSRPVPPPVAPPTPKPAVHALDRDYAQRPAAVSAARRQLAEVHAGVHGRKEHSLGRVDRRTADRRQCGRIGHQSAGHAQPGDPLLPGLDLHADHAGDLRGRDVHAAALEPADDQSRSADDLVAAAAAELPRGDHHVRTGRSSRDASRVSAGGRGGFGGRRLDHLFRGPCAVAFRLVAVDDGGSGHVGRPVVHRSAGAAGASLLETSLLAGLPSGRISGGHRLADSPCAAVVAFVRPAGSATVPRAGDLPVCLGGAAGAADLQERPAAGCDRPAGTGVQPGGRRDLGDGLAGASANRGTAAGGDADDGDRPGRRRCDADGGGGRVRVAESRLVDCGGTDERRDSGSAGAARRVADPARGGGRLPGPGVAGRFPCGAGESAHHRRRAGFAAVENLDAGPQQRGLDRAGTDQLRGRVGLGSRESPTGRGRLSAECCRLGGGQPVRRPLGRIRLGRRSQSDDRGLCVLYRRDDPCGRLPAAAAGPPRTGHATNARLGGIGPVARDACPRAVPKRSHHPMAGRAVVAAQAAVAGGPADACRRVCGAGPAVCRAADHGGRRPATGRSLAGRGQSLGVVGDGRGHACGPFVAVGPESSVRPERRLSVRGGRGVAGRRRAVSPRRDGGGVPRPGDGRQSASWWPRIATPSPGAGIGGRIPGICSVS